MIEQFYIIPGKLPKTHLAYIADGYVFTLCLPNIPLLICDCGNCKSHASDCGREAGRYDAEVWDKELSEVTCPTCLRRAKTKCRGNLTF